MSGRRRALIMNGAIALIVITSFSSGVETYSKKHLYQGSDKPLARQRYCAAHWLTHLLELEQPAVHPS